MNKKARFLDRIVEVVVDCCAIELPDGSMSLVKEDVLGKSRAENVVMTRCILAMMIVGEGFSITTAAQLMSRTPHAIRHLLDIGHNFHISSKAFRIASAQATLACREIEAEGL